MSDRVEHLIKEFYSDFRLRADEVKQYANFILALAKSNATGLAVEKEGGMQVYEEFSLGRDLTKTIRASGYLLLYNLVESTLSNSIDTIHQVIDDNDIEFEELSENIQRIALRNFKSIIDDPNHDPINSGHPIQLALVKLGYKREGLFSGNIDCRKIKDVSSRYGFYVPDPNSKGRKIGKHVLEIKNKRNDLAHGALSFEACGRDASPDHIVKITDDTIVYLRSVIRSISVYLRANAYRG